MTLHTSDTFIRINRNRGSVKEKKQSPIIEKEASEFTHPIFSPSKEKKPSKIQFKHPMTPQNTSSNSMFGKKKTEQMINKVNIRSLLYTSMVGLISGVTAAKAMHIWYFYYWWLEKVFENLISSQPIMASRAFMVSITALSISTFLFIESWSFIFRCFSSCSSFFIFIYTRRAWFSSLLNTS